MFIQAKMADKDLRKSRHVKYSILMNQLFSSIPSHHHLLLQGSLQHDSQTYMTCNGITIRDLTKFDAGTCSNIITRNHRSRN